MTDLHRVELDILKEFIKVCDKLNLTYYCIGGTALGSVRHKGFIPWDDDIDVAMPRADFDNFLKNGSKYLPDNLQIIDPKKSRHTLWYFAKIRNSNTTFVEEPIKDLDTNHGAYIDIFPIDAFPSSDKEREKIVKEYLTLHEIRMHEMYNRPYGDKTLRGIIRTIYYKVKKFQNRKYDLKNKILDNVSNGDWERATYVGTLFGMYGGREIVKKELFGSGKKVKFEDIEVIVPEKIDEYLTHMYGDYMKFPPKEKRVLPHAYFVDLNTPYIKYKTKDGFVWKK